MKIVSILLLPVSWIYGAVVVIRNWCYDRRIFHIDRVDVPVISVGNITAGGTGKTPFVEMLVRSLMLKGLKVAVLSRGYKRASAGTVVVSDGNAILAGVTDSGDEPYQIARKFSRAVVIVDERRARAARRAVEDFGADVIVMDDGFQHRALHRDLDIVLIDEQTIRSTTALLPSGLKREPLSSLRRADVLAVSCSTGAKMDSRELKTRSSAIIRVHRKPKQLVELQGNHAMEISEAAGKRCLAFCGIGNPESFNRALIGSELQVEKFITFPDHHKYTLSDLRYIEQCAALSHTEMLLTTEKDAMRLQALTGEPRSLEQPIYYLEIEMNVIEGKETLRRSLEVALRKVA